MALTNPFRSVAEHMVAITCVSIVELSCKAFVEKFGPDVHNWPIIAYVALGAIAYAAGLLSARLISRALLRARAKPPAPVAALPAPAAALPAPAIPASVTPADKLAFAVIVSTGIAAAVLAAGLGSKRKD
jgi:hypothetical protein